MGYCVFHAFHFLFYFYFICNMLVLMTKCIECMAYTEKEKFKKQDTNLIGLNLSESSQNFRDLPSVIIFDTYSNISSYCRISFSI
jgi:hypothetical protein